MNKITYLDKCIENKLIESNEKRSAGHKPSGKLSASMLSWPLQWQMLKALGVKQDAVDPYTLRKFLRGRHVEDWLRGDMPNLVDKEKLCEYRNTIGFVDALIDMTDWNVPNVTGAIPHEIKSTANSGFKWIKKSGYKKGHALQATLYALALGVDWFVLDYVASDDYRILSFLVKTSEHKAEVDKAIDEYDKQLETGIVPVFEAKEKWQESIKYNNYSQWAELTADEIKVKLKAVNNGGEIK